MSVYSNSQAGTPVSLTSLHTIQLSFSQAVIHIHLINQKSISCFHVINIHTSVTSKLSVRPQTVNLPKTSSYYSEMLLLDRQIDQPCQQSNTAHEISTA